MDDLLYAQGDRPVFRLRIENETDAWAEKLPALQGVTAVEPVEGKPEFRLTVESPDIDANSLLAQLLSLGVPIAGFQRDQRKLNDAFMDLTERGVRT